MMEDIPLPRIERFPVEAGHIMIFARAIGDSNPVYADPDYALTSRVGGIIAPPTFVEAGIHFDADFPFRPRPGQPWLGSGAGPTGLAREELDTGTDMHAETHLEYHELLRPGMLLHVSSRRGRSWESLGRRAGRLRFGEVILDYFDQDGRLVVTSRSVIVSTERKVDQPSAEEHPARAELALDPAPPYPVALQRTSDLNAGDSRVSIVAVNLSRAQIVQYAGATGDFSPQHVDEVFNTRAMGYPSVFGHGMLTMALTGRMLTDWFGDGMLKKFGFQFRRQVWPGDAVVAKGRVTALSNAADPTADIEIETCNQHGQLLGKGYAVARLVE